MGWLGEGPSVVGRLCVRTEEWKGGKRRQTCLWLDRNVPFVRRVGMDRPWPAWSGAFREWISFGWVLVFA